MHRQQVPRIRAVRRSPLLHDCFVLWAQRAQILQHHVLNCRRRAARRRARRHSREHQTADARSAWLGEVSAASEVLRVSTLHAFTRLTNVEEDELCTRLECKSDSTWCVALPVTMGAWRGGRLLSRACTAHRLQRGRRGEQLP